MRLLCTTTSCIKFIKNSRIKTHNRYSKDQREFGNLIAAKLMQLAKHWNALLRNAFLAGLSRLKTDKLLPKFSRLFPLCIFKRG